MKIHFTPEEVAPILGISAARIRKKMREGVLDLGVVIPPTPGKKSNYEYHIYRGKLKSILGEEVEDVLTN